MRITLRGGKKIVANGARPGQRAATKRHLTPKSGKHVTVPARASSAPAARKASARTVGPKVTKGVRVTMPGRRIFTVRAGAKVTLPGGRRIVVGRVQSRQAR